MYHPGGPDARSLWGGCDAGGAASRGGLGGLYWLGMTSPRARHRFFAESLDGEVVELSAGEAHHARHVLRLADGAEVEVFDGAGSVAAGAFRPVGKKAARVEIARRRRGEPARPVVEVAFAVPKGRRLEWLLEKATELGASRLSPVVFQRSVVRPSWTPHALRRWRATCVAAAKQCGSAWLPRIDPPAPLEEHLARCQAGARIVGDADGQTLVAALGRHRALEVAALLVGPEGGLTSAERQAAAEAGFVPVRLGRLTLRTETAAVALLVAVRAWAGIGEWPWTAEEGSGPP